MSILIKLLVASGVMGLMDYLWLSKIAKNLYHKEMGSILLNEFRSVPAILFYLIYVIGVTVFVINPAVAKASWQHAAVYGALFGLVAYATYDLTNLAVTKGFSTKIAIIDMTWGMLITAIVAVVSTLVAKR